MNRTVTTARKTSQGQLCSRQGKCGTLVKVVDPTLCSQPGLFSQLSEEPHALTPCAPDACWSVYLTLSGGRFCGMKSSTTPGTL